MWFRTLYPPFLLVGEPDDGVRERHFCAILTGGCCSSRRRLWPTVRVLCGRSNSVPGHRAQWGGQPRDSQLGIIGELHPVAYLRKYCQVLFVHSRALYLSRVDSNGDENGQKNRIRNVAENGEMDILGMDRFSFSGS